MSMHIIFISCKNIKLKPIKTQHLFKMTIVYMDKRRVVPTNV